MRNRLLGTSEKSMENSPHKFRSSHSRKRPLESTRPSLKRPGGATKVRRQSEKISKPQKSSIEQLPTEILQDIFWRSGNAALACASPLLGMRLSTERLKKRASESSFGFDREYKGGVERWIPIGMPSCVSLLRQKWFTFSYYGTMLRDYYMRGALIELEDFFKKWPHLRDLVIHALDHFLKFLTSDQTVLWRYLQHSAPIIQVSLTENGKGWQMDTWIDSRSMRLNLHLFNQPHYRRDFVSISVRFATALGNLYLPRIMFRSYPEKQGLMLALLLRLAGAEIDPVDSVVREEGNEILHQALRKRDLMTIELLTRPRGECGLGILVKTEHLRTVIADLDGAHQRIWHLLLSWDLDEVDVDDSIIKNWCSQNWDRSQTPGKKRMMDGKKIRRLLEDTQLANCNMSTNASNIPAKRKGATAFKPPRPTNAKGPSTSKAAKVTSRRKSAPAQVVTSLTSSDEQDDEDDMDIDGVDDGEEDDVEALSTRRKSNEDEPLASQLHDTPPTIPPKLLTRLLHHHFSDPGTRLTKDANALVGKYFETFVREAIARAVHERMESSNENGGGRNMDDLLNVRLASFGNSSTFADSHAYRLRLRA
ncbi:ADP-ribose 1''-phosphate phosphatase [Agyrium rufum]|nr:ADP-ribose 1''-phosphate phosphatase [Agyrium rufum]